MQSYKFFGLSILLTLCANGVGYTSEDYEDNPGKRERRQHDETGSYKKSKTSIEPEVLQQIDTCLFEKEFDKLDDLIFPDGQLSLRRLHYITETATYQADAAWYLGNLYKDEKVPDPYLSCKQWLKVAAEGKAEYAYELGTMYYNEELKDDSNHSNCLWALRKTAEKQHIDAMYDLGVTLFSLSTTNSDKSLIREGVELFYKAAVRGHTDAMDCLAKAYEKGLVDGKPNIELALKWFKRAADKGSTYAMYELGNGYLSGDFESEGKYDLEQAKKYFEKAAEAGDIDSMIALAQMYDEGLIGEEGERMAYYWYHGAADLGNPEAQGIIATTHMFRDDEEKLRPKIISLLKQAAEGGDAVSQTNLGHYYYKGKIGGYRDINRAYEWTEKAAYQGDRIAQYNLGRMIARGKIKRDNARQQAEFWLNLACDPNDEEAYDLALKELARLRRNDPTTLVWSKIPSVGTEVSRPNTFAASKQKLLDRAQKRKG